MKSKNSKGFTGIFQRIFAISLLCMTIPALINTVTLSRLTKKYFQDEAGHSLQNVATEKKNQMELALSSIATQAQSIANQTFLIESLNNALINSKDPDQATLRKISENLEYNFELGEGLFENIFLMYKNRDIADGIGGKSVGWEDETVGSADSLLVREVRASPTTGRPVMTIVAPIKKSNRHLSYVNHKPKNVMA